MNSKQIALASLLFILLACSSGTELTTVESTGQNRLESTVNQIKSDGLSKYTFTDVFLNNVLSVGAVNKKSAWVNGHGDWLIEPSFEQCSERIVNGLFAARANGKFGVLSIEGDTVIPFELPALPLIQRDRSTDDQHKRNGVISYRAGNKSGFYDFQGNEIEKPAYGSLFHGSVRFKQSNNYMLADFELRNHSQQILMTFEQSEFIVWIEPFHEGLAAIFIAPYNGRSANLTGANAYYGFIDESGEMVIPFQFQNNRLKMLRETADAKYNHWHFQSGTALVANAEKQLFYFIDKKGQKRFEFAEQNSVYPPTKAGYRILNDKVYNKDFEIVFNLKDSIALYGRDVYYDSMWRESDDRITLQKRSTNVIQKYEGEFSPLPVVPFEDSTYYYQIVATTQLHEFDVVKRFEKVALTAEQIKTKSFYYEQPGEIRLQDDHGKHYSGWLPGDYYYDFDLGIVVNYSRDRLRSWNKDVYIYNFDGDLIYESDSCQVSPRTWKAGINGKGATLIVKEAGGQYTMLFRDGEKISFNNELGDDSYFGNFQDWTAEINVQYPVYENDRFELKLTKTDLENWYEKLFKP